jgi:integrase/recombinase XerD
MQTNSKPVNGVLFLEEAQDAEQVNNGLWLEDPVCAFRQWRECKLASNSTKFSARSVSQHTAMWRKLVDFLEKERHSIQSVGSDTLDAFFHSLPGRPLKNNDGQCDGVPKKETAASHSTRVRYALLLQETFEHLRRSRVRSDNPMGPIFQAYRKPRAGPAAEYLNGSEERAYIDHLLQMDVTTWQSARDRALQSLIIGSGLTVQEIRNMHVGDIDLFDYEPVVRVRQHGLVHAHNAPISDFAIGPIQSWLDRRKTENIATTRLFPATPEKLTDKHASVDDPLSGKAIYKMVRDALDKIGYAGQIRGPQTLRNTFARRQLYNGVQPAQLQQWLGLQTDKTVTRLLATLPVPKGQRVA